MILRSDLEIGRTPAEMAELLRQFAEDRETISDEDIHLRRGVVKDVLEEYAPLCTLAANLPSVRSARLMRQSVEGPDAVIVTGEGKEIREISVQITVANQSYQESLLRTRLSQGFFAFATTTKFRDPADPNKINECGRAFTTRESRLRRQVRDVVAAVERKLLKYHVGTDVLLVSTRISLSDSGIAYKWRRDLEQQIQGLRDIPYRCIYIANRDSELFTLFTSSPS